jgi:hypothetical protein
MHVLPRSMIALVQARALNGQTVPAGRAARPALRRPELDGRAYCASLLVQRCDQDLVTGRGRA